MSKKYRRIKFYAFRDNKGATGGPGGVLYLQQQLIGNEINGIKCRYCFKTKKNFLRKIFNTFYKGAIGQVLLKEIFSFNNYYICNDIGTAFALSLLGRKYSLIYHQQGPIIEELTNFKNKFKFLHKPILKLIEKSAFTKAQSVHFPSKGAEEMYFNSNYRTCSRNEVKVGKVLPNTIEIKKYPERIEKNINTLTFLCVGSLTVAKGQDQTLDFIEEFLQSYKNNVRLIMIGNGPLKTEILRKGNSLKDKYSHFEFIFRQHQSHEEIMRLNEISDIYIMLHRISIFDLATLEAMSKSSAIILSKVGGNIDFNVDDNIILVDCKNYQESVKELINSNIEELKNKNKEIFENYFSKECFKSYYQNLLNEVINE